MSLSKLSPVNTAWGKISSGLCYSNWNWAIWCFHTWRTSHSSVTSCPALLGKGLVDSSFTEPVCRKPVWDPQIANDSPAWSTGNLMVQSIPFSFLWASIIFSFNGRQPGLAVTENLSHEMFCVSTSQLFFFLSC